LVGGIQSVTLGDEEAAKRGSQKSVSDVVHFFCWTYTESSKASANAFSKRTASKSISSSHVDQAAVIISVVACKLTPGTGEKSPANLPNRG
jgi:hypothetical protein